MEKPFKIFIGWDPREVEAFYTAAYSIMKYSTIPVEIFKLDKAVLVKAGVYRRIDTDVSTDFAMTRFLVPFLSKYKGWSLFMDCDQILTTDIKELYNQRNDRFAVMVVKHPEYIPAKQIKMDGQKQDKRTRKNWSSVVLWNNAHGYNRSMNPETVNNQNGKFLHTFSWLHDDYIGSLHRTWNWLCDENWTKQTDLPKLIHYTNGGPWFKDRKECINCEYADIWNQYNEEYHNMVTEELTESIDNLLKMNRIDKPRLDIKDIAIINKNKGCVGCGGK
jgi:lipopolysaccharide biosynthesis glycosyltransferase